ncbi:hypothetical protein ADUPG1_013649, partial [Aduncisulcus paluster]
RDAVGLKDVEVGTGGVGTGVGTGSGTGTSMATTPKVLGVPIESPSDAVSVPKLPLDGISLPPIPSIAGLPTAPMVSKPKKKHKKKSSSISPRKSKKTLNLGVKK